MTYTVIFNWGWFKHEDCRNAYSIHASDCRIALAAETNRRRNKIQGFVTDIATLEDAKAECLDDANCRFTETLEKFGFKHMLKICKCAKVSQVRVKK
jgi:hypothetical protein